MHFRRPICPPFFLDTRSVICSNIKNSTTRFGQGRHHGNKLQGTGPRQHTGDVREGREGRPCLQRGRKRSRRSQAPGSAAWGISAVARGHPLGREERPGARVVSLEQQRPQLARVDRGLRRDGAGPSDLSLQHKVGKQGERRALPMTRRAYTGRMRPMICKYYLLPYFKDRFKKY